LDKRDPEQAERLTRCYLEASCFCLPSSFEPFGIALSEAASVGLPAVSVDAGARREAIVHGVTGALAAEPSADLLAAALLDVLADPQRTRTLGENARAYARQHFVWDVAVNTIGRVLAELRASSVTAPAAAAATATAMARPAAAAPAGHGGIREHDLRAATAGTAL
jgi:glycosyltransferase involved in cell wall biosynthesis